MQWSASSISLHPGGSTEQTSRCLKSHLLASSAAEICQFFPSLGRQSSTFLLNGLWSTLNSWRIILVSVPILPSSPIILTNYPEGNGDVTFQEEYLIISLLFSKADGFFTFIIAWGIWILYGTKILYWSKAFLSMLLFSQNTLNLSRVDGSMSFLWMIDPP